MPELYPPRTPAPREVLDLATPNQVKFATTLLQERELYGKPSKKGMPMDESWVQQMSKGRASRLIDTLKAIPAPTAPPQFFPEVPDGRYAIELPVQDEPGTQRLYFFEIHTGQTGKWQGFRFLDHQFGPNREPIKNQEYKRLVFSLIAKDVKAAMSRYGLELGYCGRCGLELTNEESRRLGIGPVCREKLGW